MRYIDETPAGAGRPTPPGVRAGKHLVSLIDTLTDRMMVLFLCVMLALGLYCLYDSSQVYYAADAALYRAYRPEADDTVSFEELLALNPEVVGWLTVNDTPIDYPCVQAGDNRKYMDTTVEGEYRLSGSIFLDHRNSPSFSDFNTIIFGHHMEHGKMFGSLSDFADEAYFDAHPYGSLHLKTEEGEWVDKGLDFFAIVLTDAYDSDIYTPKVEFNREGYLGHIMEMAIHTRPLEVGVGDHLVLLSTCTTEITNGRYVLVGKLTDTPHPQTVPPKVDVVGKGVDTLTHFPGSLFWFVAILSLRVAVVLRKRA